MCKACKALNRQNDINDIREACRNAMKKGLPKWLAPVRKVGVPPRPACMNGQVMPCDGRPTAAWAVALEKMVPVSRMTLAQRKAELGRQAKRLREGNEETVPWTWQTDGEAKRTSAPWGWKLRGAA